MVLKISPCGKTLVFEGGESVLPELRGRGNPSKEGYMGTPHLCWGKITPRSDRNRQGNLSYVPTAMG